MPRRIHATLLLPIVLTWLGGESKPARQESLLEVGPEQLLWLVSPRTPLRSRPGGRARTARLTELDPHGLWPTESAEVAWFGGDRARWQRGLTPAMRGANLAPAYAAAYLHRDRPGELRWRCSGSGVLDAWLDGEPLGQGSGQTATLEAERWCARGEHRLLIRLEGDPASLRIEIEAGTGGLELDLTPLHAVSDYDELRHVPSIGALQLSPDGTLLAAQVRRTDEAGGALDATMLWRTQDGSVLAADLGGGRPLQWNADSKSLLLQNGGSLSLYDVEAHSLRRVLEDEPGLGTVAWSEDGRTLVFTSTRGAEARPGGPIRRTELREKLSDWPTAPHLHQLVVESGVRRRLIEPGDWLQDAFALTADGSDLVFLRNVPIEGRPHFSTEVRILDLAGGEERLVTTLRMGFENRPGMSGFALSPDGKRLAFVGPPSELGLGAEPNAFDPDLFVLELDSGDWRKIGTNLDPSVEGHLRWSDSGHELYFTAHRGAKSGMFRVREIAAGNDIVEPLPTDSHRELERVHDLSFDENGNYAAVASRTDRLPALWFGGIDRAEPKLIWDPAPSLRTRWDLATAEDASFTLENGTRLQAWLYRPSPSARAHDERLPLLVYYYGGASPTPLGFNELHQFLVAHGYALYVINPRGATGYGQSFADLHAGDWGSFASADILEGIRRVLAENADLDSERVGCFGGSYGGFMTQYLITETDRFAAAVSLYGISSLTSYFGAGMWGYTYGDQAMAGRTPWSDPEWFRAQSPLFRAERITTPLLLLHGDEDGNVPAVESEQMFTALRLLGRTVEFVSFPGEDHGLRGTWESRAAHRSMLVEWFDRYLRGDDTAWERRWR